MSPKECLDLGVKITRQIEHPCIAINNNAVTRSTIKFFWKVGFLLNAKVQRDLPLFGEKKSWLHFRLFYGLGKVIQFYCRKWICLNGREIASRIKAEKNVVLQENDKILEKKSNLFWIYCDWIVNELQLENNKFLHSRVHS